MERQQYARRSGSHVTAVQLDLDTGGFTYRKWGALQTCKRGDWVVKNDDDTYTVDRDTFRRTYQELSPGLYEKISPVWAEVAERDGEMRTKEGISHYRAGAFLVYNDADGQDGYPLEAAMFEKLYAPIP